MLHLAAAVFRAAMSIEKPTRGAPAPVQLSPTTPAGAALQDKDRSGARRWPSTRGSRSASCRRRWIACDYFSLERAEFVRRFFAAGRKDTRDGDHRAAHRKILTEPPTPSNRPSSPPRAKATTWCWLARARQRRELIVHRVAGLLRECMVLPEEIMVLAYNRSAANSRRCPWRWSMPMLPA